MSRNTREPVRQYRGSTAQHQAYTGPEGELTVDTTKMTAVVQDGVTVGGHPLMREDAPDGTTIKTNANGKLFVPVAADETVGLVKPDNETTFVDADGKLRTKSIPFEEGSLLTIYPVDIASSFPCSDTITGNIRTIIPTIGNEAFRKVWSSEPFGYFDGGDFVFTKAGMYDVSVLWSYKPEPIANATDVDLAIRIEIKRPSDTSWNLLATQSHNVDNKSYLVESIQTSVLDIISQGTRLRVTTMVPNATAASSAVAAAGLSIRVVKIPVTNEYQVGNAEVGMFSVNTSSSSSNITYGSALANNWHKLVFSGAPSTEGLPNFELHSNGMDFVCKKAGYYLLTFEHSANIISPTAKDCTIGIRKGNNNIASEQFILRDTAYNPDLGRVTGFTYLEEGDFISLVVLFTSEVQISPAYMRLDTLRLPSITQTAGTSQLPAVAGGYATANYNVQNPTANNVGNTPVILPVGEFQNGTSSDDIIEYLEGGKLKILKSGLYSLETIAYIMASQETNGRDVRVGLIDANNNVFTIGQVSLNIAEGNADVATASGMVELEAGAVLGSYIRVSGNPVTPLNLNVKSVYTRITAFGTAGALSAGDVSNPSINFYYREGYFDVSVESAWQPTIIPCGPLQSSVAPEEVPFSERLEDGRVKLLEDGFYMLVAEIGVGISDTDTTEHDIQFRLLLEREDFADFIMATGTLHLDSALGNPDAAVLSTVHYIKAGGIVSVSGRFPLTTPYGIAWVTLKLCKLPSVAGSAGSGGTASAPEVDLSEIEAAVAEAKAIAEAAQTAASSAQTAAANAQSTADTAKSTADTAKSTADTAKSTADTAKASSSYAASAGSAACLTNTALLTGSGAKYVPAGGTWLVISLATSAGEEGSPGLVVAMGYKAGGTSMPSSRQHICLRVG